MNAKIIGIIAAIVVVGAGVWYFTQNQNPSEVQNDSTTTETESELAMESTSLKELMTRGRDIECSWNSTDANNQSSGTIYVTKDKGRANFTSTDEGQTRTGHMIFMAGSINTSYVWMDGEDKGFKMSFENTTEAETSSSQGMDPNENYDYSCKSWDADSSFFEPPSNIDFQEFNIPALPAASSSTSGQTQMQLDPAAICNSLSEPAKSQCLSSIKQ